MLVVLFLKICISIFIVYYILIMFFNYFKYMNDLKIDNSDHNREGLSFVKVVHLFTVLFNKNATIVLDSVGTFTDINFDELKSKWKTSIILDIDECVAPHHGKIFSQNEEMILKLLSSWWNIVIFSNMKKSDRYENLEKLWINVITSKYSKPNKKWFNDCVESMWVDKEEVIMIGDNFLTDGWSIQAWIDFIKVEPILTEETNKSIARSIQIFMRNIADRVAIMRGNI